MSIQLTVLRYGAVILLGAISCGCASAPPELPQLDDEKARVIIAAGHFESAVLRRITDCGLTFEQAEIFDCWPPLVRSRATFVADEVFRGPARPRRIEVQFLLSAGEQVFETGQGMRYLVVITTDGRHSILAGHSILARRHPRGWAVPHTDPYGTSLRLPCGIESLAHSAIEFAAPGPRAAISSLDLDREELQDLADAGVLSIEGKHAYWKRGVTLEAVLEKYVPVGPVQLKSCF